MSKNAWMLRQDGAEFNVMHHFYVMFDDNLSSEAEVSAFLISTDSKDIDLAKYTLDAWMALLIENSVSYDDTDESMIEGRILSALEKLPYRFQYALPTSKLIDIHRSESNYNDVDTFYEFIDEVRSNLSNIQNEIKNSLNQQFCRVRFGGQYSTKSANRSLWFRISSVNFNWADVIYIFTTNHYRHLGVDSIFICRDYESDYGDVEGEVEFFYKAKDGTPYYNMPIDEYLQEDHEHNPVFSCNTTSNGYSSMLTRLADGCTIRQISNSIYGYTRCISQSVFNYFINTDRSQNCICAAEVKLAMRSRTKMRLQKVLHMILDKYSELSNVDIDEIRDRENSKGKATASEILFHIYSDDEILDDTVVSVIIPRGIADTTPDGIFRYFRIEYEDYKKFKGVG